MTSYSRALFLLIFTTLSFLQTTESAFAKENLDRDGDGVPNIVEEDKLHKGLGGSPDQKDLYLEVDYQYFTRGSQTFDGSLSQAVINKLTETYAEMGIRLHVVHDQKLPEDFDCFLERSSMRGERSEKNPLYKDSFYKLTVCVGNKDDGEGRGASPIGGTAFKILTPFTDTNPNNDAVEYAQFVRYRLVLHEMGHALGLKHGGIDGINYKVNYPSVMNYAYKWGMEGERASTKTLRGTDITYSKGNVPSLNENALYEYDAFPGMTVDQLAFLEGYYPSFKNYRARACKDDSKKICVDWNGDGFISKTSFQQRLRVDSRIQTDWADFALSRDTNDALIMLKNLGKKLPGNPGR